MPSAVCCLPRSESALTITRCHRLTNSPPAPLCILAPLLLLCLSLQAWADAVRRVLPTSKGFRRGAVASTAQLPTPGRLSQLQEEVSGGQE